jgi:mono/diheme cytochrome c family protein
VLRNLIILVLLASLAFAGFWLLTVPSVIPASVGPHTPDLANGKTMFYAGGCSSCHAVPDQDDKTRLGGGLGLNTAFGTFYVPNISPDPADGIGSWNEAQFVTALVKGTSPDSRHYYPAFPYTSFQRMKFDDLRDLFAFLRTLPAVQGTVPEHDLPLPFKVRRTLGIWKLLFLDGQPFTPDPTQSAQWNRGAYLVNGPGHCAECHSPRNFLGGIISSQRFAGGPDPEGKDWIPNITQKGIGDWSEHEIATMLETGETPDDRVAGVMKEVVANTAQLSAEDRMAMAVYVKSLPPVEGPKKPEKE